MSLQRSRQSLHKKDRLSPPPPSLSPSHPPPLASPRLPDSFSTPELISAPSSRLPSRAASPSVPPRRSQAREQTVRGREAIPSNPSERHNSHLPYLPDLPDPDYDWDDFNEQDDEPGEDDSDADMSSDLRPSLGRHHDAKSTQALLSGHKDEASPFSPDGYGSPPRPGLSRRTTASHKFREVDPEQEARKATRTRYTYAAFFLLLSLISFAVQTETAVYIQTQLHWEKAYCMLYFTHGSWSLLWVFQLIILRIQRRSTPWSVFWRRHKALLTQTAQMVRYQTMHPVGRQATENPWPYMLRTTALVTCSLTCAGISWYVAVNLTTASDLTAIYNCSAFFAYAFSVPLLKEKLRASKVFAVAVAIAGVLVVAYGGQSHTPKHGSKSGGGAGGPDHDSSDANGEHPYRFLGNIIIGVGSVLYGFYEVLYKKVACPPEECSPGRGMIFANAFGSMIGLFTLTILWIPLPILHYTGLETFELPRGEAAYMMAISVLSNAIFSGSFLVLISLTSPVLSSVAALLTIFIVALIDQLLPPPLYSPLSAPAVLGGMLIIAAFLVLSYATYREMGEEAARKIEAEIPASDIGDRDSVLDDAL